MKPNLKSSKKKFDIISLLKKKGSQILFSFLLLITLSYFLSPKIDDKSGSVVSNISGESATNVPSAFEIPLNSANLSPEAEHLLDQVGSIKETEKLSKLAEEVERLGPDYDGPLKAELEKLMNKQLKLQNEAAEAVFKDLGDIESETQIDSIQARDTASSESISKNKTVKRIQK